MEWIYRDEKYVYKEKITHNTISLYGQSLGRTIKSKKPITYMGALGHKWRKDNIMYKEKYGNALIRATIQLE